MAAAMTSFVAKNPLLAAAARRRAPPLAGRALPFSPLASTRAPRRRGLRLRTVTCFVPQDTAAPAAPVPALDEEARAAAARRVAEKEARKRSERRTYLVAAVMSSLGVTSMAVAAVYYRFSWQMEGGEVPVIETLGTFALSVGAAVGMEFWARWAHRALWHASLWHMHESHHRPREGPFELNDVFAIVNAAPAISLLAYGFFHRGIVPGLCFGAGLGITLFGMAYMFVHDGLVHRRFPVGPIADVPYFRRVAASHKIHHMDKFGGVPYGLFLGPKELEEVGGLDELVSSPVSEATDTEDAGEEKTRPVVCVVRTSVFMGQSVPNEF
uniref:beta-carotene 3-hydroxylase n=10 Tax=Zea mays TaxID=4577 RepID=D0ETP3_MAIZE|nr:beta-carotene hydroxylase 1 [Zea mays]ACX49297.1 beta-carotene hydroxylase 1 [Zea mays]ACX49301.1 beta-carotene hydroxylase 1 [Zea mays]ACX49317.1 beta-carotene hydroxylase 1 [Zea mays]ACX49431.1 beta-carotene hydroxylase 1 [Zea mays]